MTVLSDIFDIRRGHNLDLVACDLALEPSGVNFVSRSAQNNGVTGRVLVPAGMTPGVAGELTVALGGSILATFVQTAPFVVSQNVAILSPKNGDMGLAERLWWSSVIRANAYRYAYGRHANKTLSQLVVPDECPAHIVAMGDELPRISHRQDPTPLSSPSPLPPVSEWGEFALTDLFELRKGSRIPSAEREPGAIPFIGATDSRNGVTDYCDLEPNVPAGSLTVAYNGSVGSTFYQPVPCFASDDINVLVPRWASTASHCLFLVAILEAESTKYNYGRKWHLDRMRETTICLPVSQCGEPDWSAIEAYMNGLPWSRAISDNPPPTRGHDVL